MSVRAGRERLRWQCRRGMRELDVLLSAWLEREFEAASAAQKSLFQSLLELPDPQLAAYLLRGEPVGNAEMQQLVEQIRGIDRP